MHLFCDESGNTGLDLLNEDQPVFALASTNLDAEISRALVAPLLRQGQTEAKYTKLKNSRAGQQALLRFFSSDELTSSTGKFMLVDKRYYLITHLVDKLVEPPLYAAGHDLYAGDAHVGLVNVWYYTGHTIFPNGGWDRVLRAFAQVVRQRNAAAYANFERTLQRECQSMPSDSRDFAIGLVLSVGRLDEYIGVYTAPEVFDPAVDIFISMVNQWMKEEAGHLKITHDRSKPLKHREKFLRALMTPVAPRIIGYGTRQAELPLRVSHFDFDDSTAAPALQVADLIAGAAIDCLLAWSGNRQATEYHVAMRDTRLEGLFAGGMLPSPKITRENDPLPGQKSLIDGSGEFMRDIGYLDD